MQPPINGDPVNPGAQKSVRVQAGKTYPLSIQWFQDELKQILMHLHKKTQARTKFSGCLN